MRIESKGYRGEGEMLFVSPESPFRSFIHSFQGEALLQQLCCYRTLRDERTRERKAAAAPPINQQTFAGFISL